MRRSNLFILLAAATLSSCARTNHSEAILPATLEQQAAATSNLSPASHITFFNIGSDPTADVNALDIIQGLDGDIYYTTLGPTTCNAGGFCSSTKGAFGRLNPATSAFSEVVVAGAPQSVYMTPDRALWGGINKKLIGSIGSLARFATFSAAGMKQIPLPPEVGPSPEPRDVTYNTFDRDVYFTDKFGHRVGKVPLSGPYTTAAMTMYAVPNGGAHTPGFPASPHGITAASNGDVFFADLTNGTIYRLFGGTLTGFVTPEQMALGATGSSGAAYPRVASDGTLYVTQFAAGAFDRMTTSGAFTALPVGPNASPYLMRTGFGFATWSDLGNAAIGMYNLATRALREIPVAPQVGPSLHDPNGAVPTSAQTVWFTCYGPAGSGKPLCLGELTLTSTWAVFPGTTLTLNRGTSPTKQLIGIGETGNSGPFTAHSSNTNIVTVSPIANMDHNFLLKPGSIAGRATVTVNDAHHISSIINVTTQ